MAQRILIVRKIKEIILMKWMLGLSDRQVAASLNIAHSLLEDTRLDIQGYQPVIVFINGEYWGIHNIRTRYDRHYFRTYYNLTDEDMLVFEVEGADPFVYIGEAGDESFYIDLLKIIDPDYIDNDYKTVSTLSNEQAYESLSDQIDIENFITYNASQIYFNNTDWPHNNVRFWRKKNPTSYTTEDLPYGHDGKWRWMVLDIDRALRGDVEQNMLIHATEDELSATYLFRSLLENSTFQQLFINHFADLLNTNFREDVVIERINQLEDQYLPEVADQIHRWGQPDVNVNQWLRTVDQIREFANQRPAIQREHLMAYFNLPGIATVVLQTDPSMGFVKINSIDILENNTGIENPSSWSGVYFQGVPIQLTAVPQPGFRFSHWEGVPGNSVDFTSETIILELFDDLDIHAVFSPEEP